MLALWPACALLVAGGLAAPRPRALGVLAAVLLCVMGLITAGAVAFDRNLERPDWRVVASALDHPGVGGHAIPRVILVQHYKDLLPLSLYMPRLAFWRGHDPVPVSVREFDVVSFTSPASAGFCWWGSACNLWPSPDAGELSGGWVSRGVAAPRAPVLDPAHGRFTPGSAHPERDLSRADQHPSGQRRASDPSANRPARSRPSARRSRGRSACATVRAASRRARAGQSGFARAASPGGRPPRTSA